MQKALRPVLDVFAAFASELRREIPSASDDNFQLCPFCDFAIEEFDPSLFEQSHLDIAILPNDIHKEVRDHIAAHLETTALGCLLGRENLDDNVSNELQRGILDSFAPSDSSESDFAEDQNQNCGGEDKEALMVPMSPESKEALDTGALAFLFDSSQLGVDNTYVMEADPILMMFSRNRIDDVQHFLLNDIDYVHSQYPLCSREMAERLGKENTRRRQYFHDCAKHSDTSSVQATHIAAEPFVVYDAGKDR
jgi:hypothetical protein